MDNQFIEKGIEIVKDAVEADNSKKYNEALILYKKSLEHFMIGLKCKLVFTNIN